MFIYDSEGKKRKALTVVCNYCQCSFLALEKEVKRGRGKFCSIECATKENNKQIELKCDNCSSIFKKKRSHLKNSKSGKYFCCRKCKDIAQRIGGIIEIMPNHYNSSENRSRSVYRRLYKEFQEIEFLSCKRCNYCEFECGIDIHHIDGNFKNNTKENMIALCAPCHRALHEGLWLLNELT